MPLNAEAQLLAARDAILRASKDGVTRQQLRTLLRRDGELVPPDETWTGGHYAPTARATAARLLRKIGEARDDKPSLREQRLDVSGVDGESLLVAEGENARNDASLFIQPSSEVQQTIESVCAAAGPRLVLTLNPAIPRRRRHFGFSGQENRVYWEASALPRRQGGLH